MRGVHARDSWILCAAIAIAGAGAFAADAPLRVAVSIAPEAFFVEKTAGKLASVSVLVEPGQSPETYDPTASHLAEVMDACLYFPIGMSFETRVLEKIRASAPSLRVVDLREGIALRRMTEAHDHDDGAANPDPHIWLSPRNVAIMAQTICSALSAAAPEHAAEFQANTAAFRQELAALDERLSALLAPVRGYAFYVYHPAYGYFADAYGLKQIAVETQGAEPSAKQLAALIDGAKSASVKVVFIQPQFSRKSAEAVAHAVGATLVPMDPLARDCLANLEDMARKICQAAEASGK